MLLRNRVGFQSIVCFGELDKDWILICPASPYEATQFEYNYTPFLSAYGETIVLSIVTLAVNKRGSQRAFSLDKLKHRLHRELKSSQLSFFFRSENEMCIL